MLTEVKSAPWSVAELSCEPRHRQGNNGGKAASKIEKTSGSYALHSQLLINCMGQCLARRNCSGLKVSLTRVPNPSVTAEVLSSRSVPLTFIYQTLREVDAHLP